MYSLLFIAQMDLCVASEMKNKIENQKTGLNVPVFFINIFLKEFIDCFFIL